MLTRNEISLESTYQNKKKMRALCVKVSNQPLHIHQKSSIFILQTSRSSGPFIYYVIYEWLLIIIHIGSKSIRFPLDHCRPLKHHLTRSSAAWHRIAKTQKFLKCCRPKNFTGSLGYHYTHGSMELR